MEVYRWNIKHGRTKKRAIQRASSAERGHMTLHNWNLYNLRLARIAKRKSYN